MATFAFATASPTDRVNKRDDDVLCVWQNCPLPGHVALALLAREHNYTSLRLDTVLRTLPGLGALGGRYDVLFYISKVESARFCRHRFDIARDHLGLLFGRMPVVPGMSSAQVEAFFTGHNVASFRVLLHSSTGCGGCPDAAFDHDGNVRSKAGRDTLFFSFVIGAGEAMRTPEQRDSAMRVAFVIFYAVNEDLQLLHPQYTASAKEAVCFQSGTLQWYEDVIVNGHGKIYQREVLLRHGDDADEIYGERTDALTTVAQMSPAHLDMLNKRLDKRRQRQRQ